MSANKNPTPPARKAPRSAFTAGQQFAENSLADLAASPALAVVATAPAGPLMQPFLLDAPNGRNTLAAWYHSLSTAAREEFPQALAEAGIPIDLFWTDAAPDGCLSLLPFWRLDWYRGWFLGHGYADLFAYVRLETDDTPYQAPEWESKLEAWMVAEFKAISGPNALPLQEFYRTTPHGYGQLIRLISECSQRELNPQRKPMWQALRALVHKEAGHK